MSASHLQIEEKLGIPELKRASSPEKRSPKKEAYKNRTRSPSSFFAEPQKIKHKGKKLKILIVDDSQVNRKVLNRLLSDFECVQAENGKIAVDTVVEAQAKVKQFDLILMDLEMPVMDGQEATNEIREIGYQGPILCVSGTIPSEDKYKKINGMNGFLYKPVRVKDLQGVIDKYSVMLAGMAEVVVNTETTGSGAKVGSDSVISAGAEVIENIEVTNSGVKADQSRDMNFLFFKSVPKSEPDSPLTMGKLGLAPESPILFRSLIAIQEGGQQTHTSALVF